MTVTASRPSPKARTAVPAPLVGAGLGRVAYDAYSASVGGKSMHGEKLPTFDEQVKETPHISAAWCAAAQAVITALIERNPGHGSA